MNTQLPTASVHFGQAVTLNMGNYESTRLEVSVTLPADAVDLDTAMKSACEFVERHLSEQVAQVMSDKNQTPGPKRISKRKK